MSDHWSSDSGRLSWTNVPTDESSNLSASLSTLLDFASQKEELDERTETVSRSRLNSAFSSIPDDICSQVDLHDSGIVTDETDESADDDDYESNSKDSCDEGCHCHKLRDWLRCQESSDFDISKDEFYVSNKQVLWDEKAVITDYAQCNYDPFPTLANESFRFAGPRDKFGRPNGRGQAYFPNGRKFVGTFQKGRRNGAGELFEREGGRILRGTYKNDRLHGFCEIATNEGGRLEMIFDRGVAHGPVRRFSPEGNLQWFGRYRFGMPFGSCWRSNDHESWYYGSTNRSGRMTGENIIYIFPDFHTALVGKWHNDILKSAKLAKVICTEKRDGLLVPLVDTEDISDVIFTSDVSGYSHISSRPKLRDPYEDKFVDCRASTITGGGEGLFAKQNIPPETVISFYNGIRFHDCHAFNDWEHNSYKIRLNEKKKQILDIPRPQRDLANYCATLAHKVNHSFLPNSRFSDFAHPRFGRILCVKSLKAIKKGEEIFCNYGYNLEDCPRWYKALHDQFFFDSQATLI